MKHAVKFQEKLNWQNSLHHPVEAPRASKSARSDIHIKHIVLTLQNRYCNLCFLVGGRVHFQDVFSRVGVDLSSWQTVSLFFHKLSYKSKYLISKTCSLLMIFQSLLQIEYF